MPSFGKMHVVVIEVTGSSLQVPCYVMDLFGKVKLKLYDDYGYK